MRIFILVLIFLQFSISAQATDNELLTSYCLEQKGTIIDSWTCPNSKKIRNGLFCVVKNYENKDLVFNGCTASVFGYGVTFFKACVSHDLCYHNEPAVSNKSKADCDKKLLNDMYQICDQESGGYSCYLMARTFYDGVVLGGADSWNCSKNDANYIGAFTVNTN